MEKIDVFIIVYFITFAVIDFIIYVKLSKYLYMSGGATKEDVKLYLSKQVMHGQRRLVDWLYNRTPRPDLFDTMLTVCNILTGVTSLTPILIFFLAMSKNKILIAVCAVAVAVISAVTAFYGFSYSKKIKEEFATYFDSSRYKPYTVGPLSERIDSEDEIYVEPVKRRTLSFTQKEKEKVDKQVKVGQRAAIILIFLIIMSIPFVALIQSRINSSKNDDTTTEQMQQVQLKQQITGIKNVKAVLGISEEVRLDASDEIKILFSEFDFSEECIVIKDRGIYFGYYELNNKTGAAELQKEIKTKILNDFNYFSQDFDEKDESKENFTIYSFESEDIFAVSICCNTSVIYAYSNLNNEAWLKSLLNDLGYLEDF